MQIEIHSQFSPLVERLNQAYHHLGGDLGDLMSAIGATLENSTRQRFAEKRSADGVAWASLLPSTQRQKRGRGGILVDRGDLAAGITFYANANEVRIGTPEHYGKYHQGGTPKLVARPFLGISTQDEQDIQQLIQIYLAQTLGEHE